MKVEPVSQQKLRGIAVRRDVAASAAAGWQAIEKNSRGVSNAAATRMAAVVTAAATGETVPSSLDQTSVRHAMNIGGGTSQINMMHSTHCGL